MTLHRIRIALATVALVSVGAANAHHAMDPSDGTPIQLKGTIDFISWDGAHVMYKIRAPDVSGVEKLWEVLGASPKILASRHIEKSTMHVGERIELSGSYNPHSKQIAPYTFTTEDGRQYEMGFYPSSKPPSKPR